MKVGFYVDQTVHIYTDGACQGNPGPGGWAAVLRWGEHEREMSGYEPNTTNQRMELQAVLQALRALTRPCKVAVHSDSAYVVNAFKQKWLERWERNGWTTSKETPVENQDLWRELLAMTRYHQVDWVKVKGHADDELNNRCDALARQAIRQAVQA